MRVLPVDIEGLNLILGGGIPVFKRHETFADESATLVVRGPPGSAKTVLGTQLASSLASSLGADVAYACIELLPSELAAQRAGLKQPKLNEKVVEPPFPHGERIGDECRIYAGILDLGTPVDEQARLVPAIEEMLAVVREAGGSPRVLVVDSLSDGYHLGASAPRPLADELCKMAVQQGIVLILLEEAVDRRPSAWSFATDVVLELGPADDMPAPGSSDPFERRLSVTKNRFGPSEPGVHRFGIMPGFGIRVLPHPRAYLSHWAANVVLAGWTNEPRQPQGWTAIDVPTSWPFFNACVVAVHGSVAADVRRVANMLGLSAMPGGLPIEGGDLVLDFSRVDGRIDPHEMQLGTRRHMGCGDPYLSGDWLLAAVVENITVFRERQVFIRRVLVGDLQSLRSFWNPEGIRQALGALASLLRRVGIPMVLFETSSTDLQPHVVDFSDVTMQVIGQQPLSVIAYHARSGTRVQAPVNLALG